MAQSTLAQRHRQPSLLEELLSQYDDPQVRLRILQLIQKTGLQEDDPIFLIMLGTASVQALLENGPQRIRQAIEYGQSKLMDQVKGYESVCRKGIEKDIAESAKHLIQKATAAKSRVTALSLGLAGATLLATLLLGIAGGVGFSQWRLATTEKDPRGPIQLSLKEAKALNWAMSPEGQYAQDLIRWNKGWLEGCEQSMDRFAQTVGLTIQQGSRQAKNGFCLLWTTPPEQREWIEVDPNNTSS